MRVDRQGIDRSYFAAVAQALLSALFLGLLGLAVAAFLGLRGGEISRHITFGFFSAMLTMLAHSANKIGLSATVNEFVSAQVVVLGSAQYLGRSAGFRRRQVHPSGTGEAGRAPDSPPSYQGGRRQAE